MEFHNKTVPKHMTTSELIAAAMGGLSYDDLSHLAECGRCSDVLKKIRLGIKRGLERSDELRKGKSDWRE